MKARRQLQMRPAVGVIPPAEPDAARSSSNSSTTLAVTVLADVDDVLAVVRTAVLLGRSFGVSTSLNLLGEDAAHIESGEDLSRSSLAKLLAGIKNRFSRQEPQQAQSFALEVSITAASFLAAGTISVVIRSADPAPKRPKVAR